MIFFDNNFITIFHLSYLSSFQGSLYSILSNLSERKKKTDEDYDTNRLKHTSPVAWQHINFLGRYEFERIDKPISIDKLVDEIKF